MSNRSKKVLYRRLAELENTEMIDEMTEDYQEFQNKFSVWKNEKTLWQKWIRVLKWHR